VIAKNFLPNTLAKVKEFLVHSLIAKVATFWEEY
jgi:hypothetical protein